MYEFVDTNEASVGNVLPTEAMLFNGRYIEDLISGYRTLHVSGREALAPELEAYETGIRDGSKLQSKRYPARILTVTYQLIAESSAAFREAYNRLGGILNTKNAVLIFNDEPDKFFIGTPSDISAVEPGKNAVTGEIEITCHDPFKYSTTEYEAVANIGENNVLIDYNGTYKAYPKLIAEMANEYEINEAGTQESLTGKCDCGFVAFFNGEEKIVQIGDPDEADAVEQKKSQTLVNQSFTGQFAWSAAAQNLWTINTGALLPTKVQKMGAVAMTAASYAYPEGRETSGSLITVNSDKGKPGFKYKVSAKTYNRTETTVTVDVTITTSLATSTSYFGNGYGLKASVNIGGAWHEKTLKKTSEYWSGTSGHTAKLTVTVEDLTAADNVLKDIQFKVERSDSLSGDSGNLAAKKCTNLPIATYIAPVANAYYLAPSSYGSAVGTWHGPSITRTLGADASGEVGAKDFTFTFKHRMCVGDDKTQMGGLQIMFTTASGENIAGVRISKSKPGNIANMAYYVMGEMINNETVDLSASGTPFKSTSSAASKITKSKGKFTFNVGGVTRTYSNAATAFTPVERITIAFEQYSVTAPLEYNGLYSVKLVKDNCETYKEVPNKFSANDVVEADCKNGEIYLNGTATPALGALGNDWEDFVLTPGLNQIGFTFSDWVALGYEPTFKVRYREVFL